MATNSDNVVPLPASDSFSPNDVGNAQRFANYWAGIVFHVPERGWMVYDGKRWVHDDKRVMLYAIDTVGKIPDPKWRDKSQSRAKLNAMLKIAAEAFLDGDLSDFDTDPWLFNCANGTLDLHTGLLHKHDPMHRLTRASPVQYNPEASSADWQAFLADIMPGEMIEYLQRVVGYSLTGKTTEHCLFFCHGRGRNGKTVFLETILAALGDYGMSSATQILTRRSSGSIPNDVARLAGSRFVSLSETGDGQSFSEPLLKDLTGGDTVTARLLFKEWFDFKPQCKLWIRGNHLPAISGTDDGIWRRFRLIPFSVQIPESEVDTELADKLKNNLPGVLRWAVEGCLKWQESGLKTPAAVTDAVKAYREESDPIGQFIEECCLIDPEAVVQATALYQAFRMWATQAGEKKLSQTRFGRSLSSRGFERGKISTKVYFGLALKSAGQ